MSLTRADLKLLIECLDREVARGWELVRASENEIIAGRHGEARQIARYLLHHQTPPPTMAALRAKLETLLAEAAE